MISHRFGITLPLLSLKSFLGVVICSVYLSVAEFILNDIVDSLKVYSYVFKKLGILQV